MATKVRGITIELGADTTGISKALSNVNRDIGQTQRELRDVEKLLKLDPGNTELLAQKHRMLGDRVSETKDKLETLKAAQDEITKAYQNGDIDQGQYDAFQREIISCENELKNLQKEFYESNVAAQKLADIGDGIEKAGQKISGVGDKLTKSVTTPILGLGATALTITADFDAAMAKVKAISGATEEDFEKLRAKAREMGEQTKFSATDSANAMEYMAMAGWKTENMLEGIEGIMNLAAASGEDLATTSDIVTDALTAFGLKAEDSGRFADLLAKTAASANTNVSMMGETFKYAAPVMGAMGYSAEDTALAIGLMGNAGIKASNAGTALRGMVTRLAKPTKDSSEAMARLGLELYDEEGKMYSFYEIMEQLRGAFDHINMPVEEFDQELARLQGQLEDGTLTQKKFEDALDELVLQTFGAEEAEKARAAAMLAGKNALSGLLAIVNASDEDFNNLKKSIDESSGAAQSMAEIMQDNAAGQVEILMSQLQELAISMGDILIPIFREVVKYVQDLVDKFNGLDDSQKETIVKVLAVTAAIGPLLSILGRLTSGLGSILMLAPKLAGGIGIMQSAFSKLWAVILANPIVAIGAAVVALIALIATKGDELQAKLQQFDNFLQGVFAKDWTQVFGPVLGGVINSFMSIFKTQWDAIKKVLDGIIDFIRGVFTGNWERAWNGVKKIFGGVFDGLIALAKAPINKVIAMINGMFSGINSVASKVGSSIQIPTIPMLANGGIVSSGSAIVGEAGAELLNVNNGVATVQPLTSGGNSGHTDITDLLSTYLPYLAEGTQLVLDSGVLVGATAPQMNDALGKIAVRARTR